jgi:hypothetical protein
MTGYTIERRNYIKLINSDTYETVDAMPPNDMSQRGLASRLFKEMLDNGFKLIWSDSAPTGDPTNDVNLWNAKQVVFEPTTTVDPLSPSLGTKSVVAKPQGWRIGFIVDGYQDNQLIAYLGTAKTHTTSGIKTEYSYPVVLVQGGASQGEGRIGIFNEHSFRLSITERGVAVLVWAARYIETMDHMGLLCVQRPVKYDGTPVIDGYAPVFALHNTDPVGYARPVQTDRFFRTVVREKDAELPTMSTLLSIASNRYATGTITFSDLTVDYSGTPSGTTPPLALDVVFNINGVQINMGWNALAARGSTQGFDTSTVGHVNGRIYTGPYMANAPGPLKVTKKKLVEDLYAAIVGSNDARLQQMSFIPDADRGLLHVISKVPGNTNFTWSLSGPTGYGGTLVANTAPILSPTGALGGGGKGWKPNTGTLRIGYGAVSTTPAAIIPGTDAFQMGSVTVSFSSSPSPSAPTGTAVIAVPTGGTYSTNQFNSLICDNIITWINSNRSKYPEFNGIEVTKTGSGSDPSLWTTLVFSKDPRKVDSTNANDFVLSAATANVSALNTVGNKLAGGATNQASETITFNYLPASGTWLEINGTRFTFVDNPYAGFREISTVVDNSDANWLGLFVQRIADVISADTSINVQKASYASVLDGSGNPTNVLKVTYREPGFIGNAFTIIPGLFDSVQAPVFSHGYTLTGGCGSSSSDGSTGSNTPDDVSEMTGRYGTSMYRVPNVWEGPVTTDTGEYVLLFPFGLCSGKVAFTEEMDMVAISKGAAYQGIQDVSIDVYGDTRTYTSYNSNLSTQKDYVRIFLLTGGGDI